MKKILLLFIITFFVMNQLSAQLQGQGRVDSLLRQLPKANEDTKETEEERSEVERQLVYIIIPLCSQLQ